MSKKEKILLVEDDKAMRESCHQVLEQAGYFILDASSGSQAETILLRETIDLIVTDLRMPQGGGQELIKTVKNIFSGLPIIIITAYPSVESAVAGFKDGVVDYLVKPFTGGQLLKAVENSLKASLAHDRAEMLRHMTPSDPKLSDIIGNSSRMTTLITDIRHVASLDGNVLVVGETGSGKELVTKAIHHFSKRSLGPLITVNCATIPENLFEAEMFGFKKGAFPEAKTVKPGLIEQAHKGILCLDKVEEMPGSAQSKLLRVLDEKECRRIGEVKARSVDIRIISMTQKNLNEEINVGRFREDFFYRLSSLEIHVPPLREHAEDIPQLAVFFLDHLREKAGHKPIVGFSDEALDLLSQHSWPGNVRELQNAIQKIYAQASGSLITVEDIEQSHAIREYKKNDYQKSSHRQTVIGKFESDYLIKVLKKHNNNITHASCELGIHRTTLQRLLKKYKLNPRLLPTTEM